MDEPTSTIHQILRRLDALEAQVAVLAKEAGVTAAGRPPEPAPGMPIPSSGYGSLGAASQGGAGPAFPDVVQLARSGNKIAAIKLYRDYTGAGLKEAKTFVDNV